MTGACSPQVGHASTQDDEDDSRGPSAISEGYASLGSRGALTDHTGSLSNAVLQCPNAVQTQIQIEL